MRMVIWGAVIVLLIVFGPLAVIWSLNTLFATGIAYTFTNWCAMVILSAAFGKAHINVKK
jgi:hypothetical protein